MGYLVQLRELKIDMCTRPIEVAGRNYRSEKLPVENHSSEKLPQLEIEVN